MSKSSNQIIIVRKRKKHKHAHHGGSWKIAYADFMTAMMAFFLVMWLLSSSTPLQREQIADYFKMPLKVALSSGDKSSLSSSPIPGGGDDLMKQSGEVFKQTLTQLDKKKITHNLQRAHEMVDTLIHKDPRLSNFQSNLRLSLTDDGLLIQIVDTQERPMFKIGSKTPEPYMHGILQALVPVLNNIPNHINITGHTDSLPYANGDAGYGNWELSSDRANASRQMLVTSGLDDNKFLRVIGTADKMALENIQPNDPVNRRISILVLSMKKEQSIRDEDTVLQNISDSQSSEKIKAELKKMSGGAEMTSVPPANILNNSLQRKGEQDGHQ